MEILSIAPGFFKKAKRAQEPVRQKRGKRNSQASSYEVSQEPLGFRKPQMIHFLGNAKEI
jgi:hypothetical protein